MRALGSRLQRRRIDELRPPGYGSDWIWENRGGDPKDWRLCRLSLDDRRFEVRHKAWHEVVN
jgi:hypothetical protein